MLFKIVCYVVVGAAFCKELVGIFAHDKLYGWAKKHYSTQDRSFTVWLFLIYGVGVVGTILYATIFQI